MPALKSYINKINPDFVYFTFAGIVAVGVSAINLFDPINIYSFSRDVWHHLAVLNALMDSPFDATNPHIVSDDPSRTFMPWFLFIALLGKAFSLSALQALGLSAVFNMTALTFGVRMFAREYYKNDWAPLVLLISILGGWGLYYNYVGISNIETFIFCAGYPATTIIAFSFFAWWAVLKFLNSPNKNPWYLIFIALFCAFAFPTHQLQAGFAIGTMGVLAAFSEFGSLKKGLFVGLAAAAGLALSSLWFYYNPIELLFLSAWDPGWQTHKIWYSPSILLFTVGVGYMGVFGFYNYKQSTWRWDLVIGFAVIFLGFWAGKFLDSPISHRFYPFWAMFLHFGLTWFILEWPLGFKLTKNISGFRFLQNVTAILLLFSALLHFNKSIDYYILYRGFSEGLVTLNDKGSYPAIMEAAEKLPAYFNPDDVLIAHIETAYPAQAVGIKLVSIPRPFPLVPDMAERQKASDDFFKEDFTDAQRWEILDRYGVSHILYREFWAETWMPEGLKSFGDVIDINGDLKLIIIDFSLKLSENTNEVDNRS